MMYNSRIAQVSKLVSEKLGLHFPENRYHDLSSGLALAAEELGFDEGSTAFTTSLLELKLTGKQLDVLAEKLTIGETYFFREKQSLAAFRDMIVPAIINEREHTSRSIRFWSAGCCSGEEPYTLAMMLSEIPGLASWHITILATDINRRFLDKATKGVYTPWSFRETPAETQKKYFTPAGRDFEISDKIRRMVTFKHLNLVDDPFPSDKNNTNAMDVIFCRNVLMYFTPDSARAVGEKFYRSLNDKGWLITSQVELSDELFHPLNKVNFNNCFLYQKTGKPQKNLKNIRISQNEHQPKRITLSRRTDVPKENTCDLPVVSASVLKADAKDPVSEGLSLARDYANKGDLKNAFRCSEELIPLARSNPEVYYLLGMILFELGEFSQAEQQLKRALYLDPDHLLAHFQMATLSIKAGKERQARKHKENVHELLQRFRDEDLVPGAEEMTAGHLKGLLITLNTSGPHG